MGKRIMGMYVNRITLLGNAGQDPEVKTQQYGDMATFTLATSTKNKEGAEKTEWHRIIARGNLVPIVNKIVQKGGKYYIEGKMTYRQYTDNQGQKKSIPEIVLYEIISCAPSKEYNTPPAEGGYPQPQQPPPASNTPPEKPVYTKAPHEQAQPPRYQTTPSSPAPGPPAHTAADLPPDDDLPF